MADTVNDFEKDDESEILDLLEILGELHQQRAVLVAPLVAQITTLQEEMAEATAALDEQIASVEKAVKRAVIAHGNSVKGEHVRAIYVKPRVTWDGKRLEGYAEAHPEIKAFRRVGKPNVRIADIE